MEAGRVSCIVFCGARLGKVGFFHGLRNATDEYPNHHADSNSYANEYCHADINAHTHLNALANIHTQFHPKPNSRW